MLFERPLLLFPEPSPVNRFKKSGGESKRYQIPHSRQVKRVTPMFQRLADAVSKSNLQISDSSEGTEPEYTLVWEVANNVEGFINAVKRLNKENPEAAELLFETDKEEIAEDDFYPDRSSGIDDKKPIVFKFFCIVVNLRILKEILELWEKYKKNENYSFPRGLGRFKDIFQYLKDVHLWGEQERIEETGVLDVWKDELAITSTENVICEVELFYRKNPDIRSSSEKKIRKIVEDFQGEFLRTSVIPEIGYHAILISIPREYVRRIVNHESVELVKISEIMFLRATGQSIIISSDGAVEITQNPDEREVEEEPIVALFDGLPQENHPFLKDRLIVDDPDNYTQSYSEATSRKHGTSMASLIVHGEIKYRDSKHEFDTIQRKIYVRPIMKSYPWISGTMEQTSETELIVDKIHVAVRRLFEPNNGRVAPTIKIINLSIGIRGRLMYDMMSPLARLLDYLSLKYRVLFIVSAGNHCDPIPLPCTFDVFKEKSEQEKDQIMIQYYNSISRQRKLLSPAESMNALTVGACFMDSCGDVVPQSHHLAKACSDGMPSPTSAVGTGKKRSVKPDILFPGGRKFIQCNVIHNESTISWPDNASAGPPGILSAVPINIGTSNMKAGYTFGTSDATALISHNAVICYEALHKVFQAAQRNMPEEHVALLLKAMLVHGARWNQTLIDIFSNVLGMPSRQSYSDKLHRWFGYGVPDIERVIQCTKNRVTLIGYGSLTMDGAKEYSLPLPFDFHSGRIKRDLTVTLASFTPTQSNSQKYRVANVFFNIENGAPSLFDYRTDVDWRAVQRGTLQHEHFQNDEIVPWNSEEPLCIKVNCMKDAKEFDEEIPYAIFVTLEIALGENSDIDVYQEIAQRIPTPIQIANT